MKKNRSPDADDPFAILLRPDLHQPRQLVKNSLGLLKTILYQSKNILTLLKTILIVEKSLFRILLV